MNGQPMTIGEVLEQAERMQRSGRKQVAEQLYRVALQVEPNQDVVDHNLGLLAVRHGRTHEGRRHFKAALEASPTQGGSWNSFVAACLLERQRAGGKAISLSDRREVTPEEALPGLEWVMTHNDASKLASTMTPLGMPFFTRRELQSNPFNLLK